MLLNYFALLGSTSLRRVLWVRAISPRFNDYVLMPIDISDEPLGLFDSIPKYTDDFRMQLKTQLYGFSYILNFGDDFEHWFQPKFECVTTRSLMGPQPNNCINIDTSRALAQNFFSDRLLTIQENYIKDGHIINARIIAEPIRGVRTRPDIVEPIGYVPAVSEWSNLVKPDKVAEFEKRVKNLPKYKFLCEGVRNKTLQVHPEQLPYLLKYIEQGNTK